MPRFFGVVVLAVLVAIPLFWVLQAGSRLLAVLVVGFICYGGFLLWTGMEERSVRRVAPRPAARKVEAEPWDEEEAA